MFLLKSKRISEVYEYMQIEVYYMKLKNSFIFEINE